MKDKENTPNKRGRELYYITHINNLESIFEHGILSHNQVIERDIKHETIYNPDVVNRRQERLLDNGKTLWDYTNFYFQPRNPMLHTVTNGATNIEDHVVLSISFDVINDPDVLITTGNAAAHLSNILPKDIGLKLLPRIIKSTNLTFWKKQDGTNRKIMAECLVPDFVPPEKITSVFVAAHSVAKKIKPLLPSPGFSVFCEPHMFFQNSFEQKLSYKLRLVKGDMFFSKNQTLTISVNTVGAMGRGVASRSKQQFPDTYVVFQDLCRRNPNDPEKLRMGVPHLYKRELSSAYEMAEDPSLLTHINGGTWFIFFPTKDHFKNKANSKGIEQGLQWIRDNYKRQGIKSLAVPALGCGLGKLKWDDVGPMMCQYLDIDIPVDIHLPLDEEIPKSKMSRKFLFPNSF